MRSLPDSWPRRTTCPPTVTHCPALCGFFLQQRFHYAPTLPKPPAGRAGARSSLDKSLPGDKPILEDTTWSTLHAFQPRCGVMESCPRGCGRPCAAAPMLFLLSSFLLSFSLSLLVRFGGCWAGSPTGMLWGNYAVRVAAGCRPGEHKGDRCRRVSVCLTPVLTLSCVCRDWSVLLCTYPCIAPGCIKGGVLWESAEGIFFASNAIPCLQRRVLSLQLSVSVQYSERA